MITSFTIDWQVYVDQIHHDVHAITRHNPDQRKTVVLVAHSAFHHPSEDLQPTIQRQNIHMGGIPPLTIPGDLCIYIAAWFLGVGAKKRDCQACGVTCGEKVT